MKAWIVPLIFLQSGAPQAPAPVAARGDDATAGGPEAPAPVQVDGEALLARVLEDADRGERGAAFAAADEGLAALASDPGAVREETRARLHFARGVLGAELPEPRPAAESAAAFASARALAGPGELRLHATYDGGVVHLQEGERHRAAIPEVGGQGGQAGPGSLGLPVPGAPPGADGADAPDPLELARAAYLEARERLIQRLRLGWRDPDTRANLELCMRRLRELDEIERQREEQQQEQEGEGSDSESEGEPSDEPSEQEGEPEEQDGSQDPSEESGEGENRPQEERPEGQGEQEPQTPQDGQSPEPGEEQADAGPEEPAERHLTREEAMRLLDRLKELEDEARQLEALLREARRVPVERDW